MKQEISFKCSPEQEEVIADHALSKGRELLGIQPDERAWILSNARAVRPGCKVLAADLDIENGMWYVDIEFPDIHPQVQIEEVTHQVVPPTENGV